MTPYSNSRQRRATGNGNEVDVTDEELDRIMSLYAEPWSTRDNLELGRMIKKLLDRGVSQQGLSRRTRSYLARLEREEREEMQTRLGKPAVPRSQPSDHSPPPDRQKKSMTPGTIHHFVSLLDLPDELQRAVADRTLKFKAARALVDLTGDFDGHQPISKERLIELSQPFMTRKLTTQHAEKYVAYARRRPEMSPDELIDACLNGPPPPRWDEDWDSEVFESGGSGADYVGIEHGSRSKRRRPAAYAPLAAPGELLAKLREKREAVEQASGPEPDRSQPEASTRISNQPPPHQTTQSTRNQELRRGQPEFAAEAGNAQTASPMPGDRTEVGCHGDERPGKATGFGDVDTSTSPDDIRTLHSGNQPSTHRTRQSTRSEQLRRGQVPTQTQPSRSARNESATVTDIRRLAEQLFTALSSTRLDHSPDALLARVYLKKLQALLENELLTAA